MARATTRNRVFVLLGTSLSLGVAMLASCSLPNVTFSDTPTGSEGGEGSTGQEGGNPEGSTKDGPVDAPGDAAVIEAAARDDATAKVPDGSCVPEDCDCDKDLFLRSNCDSGTNHPTKLDCDDFDPLRKPDAGLTEELPDNGQVPKGDWNCDGHVDKAYYVNVKCGGTILTGCTGGPGFTNDPECGTSADYFQCGVVGLGCGLIKEATPRKQGCK